MERDYIKQGDCLELMNEIPDGSIDLILCDLPYGNTGSKWDKVIDADKLWGEYRRIIKANGTILLFGAEPFCTHMRSKALDLYKYDWIWHKQTVTGFAHAKNRPLRDYENIMVFSKGTTVHAGQSKNRMTYNPQGLVRCNHIRNTDRSTGSYMHDRSFASKHGTYVQEYTNYPRMVLNFSKKVTDTKYHINAKPIDLLEYLIRTYSNEGETVLDNCMGSGSTGVACVNTGRNFIGFELDAGYFHTAKSRIEDAINNKNNE